MGGDSTMVESSGDDMAAPGIHEGSEIGMVGSNSGEEDKVRVDEGERGVGGKRWPRQETLALLKIRSDMDAVFRDSSLKGPLWEEVSRKLGELGYHRSAKKCKEKFENVYKYHKRTKDGRTSKTDGKTYKFFDELEALGNLHSLQATSPPKPQTPIPIPTNNYIHVQTNPTVLAQTNVNPTIVFTQAVPLHYVNPYSANTVPSSNFHNVSSNLFSTSTSSSTASDVDSDRETSKRKRKWKVFFRRLTKKVVQIEEELQNKFLQTIERCEKERTAREEAWRVQEMARINREHEILVQERLTAVAKDAAVIAFLQKMSGQQPDTVQVQPRETPPSHQPKPPPPQVAAPLPLSPPPLNQPQPLPPTQTLSFDIPKMTNIGENNNPVVLSSPSRWPKAEVEALINLRTNLDVKYQENLPKASLWEEISAGMKKLGYNRSSKRCKEKWENINKYFKKVKESNKKRPEDSKTCPYFHQLDAIYRERSIRKENPSLVSSEYGVNEPANGSSMVPLMVQPEQQWPPLPQQQQAEEAVRGNVDRIQEDDDDDEDDDIGESEEEYEGNDFELVANKTAANAMDTAK